MHFHRRHGRTWGPPRARRAYGASAARFEVPRAKEMRREAGLRVARPRVEGRWEGARARTPRVGRRAAGDVRRTGARRRGVLAPGLKQFC
jgi:hypothetical protein